MYLETTPYSPDTIVVQMVMPTLLYIWLKPREQEGCAIHSFRHAMRDRLRAMECPSDIIDGIGDWQISGVGQRYENAQPLNVRAKWMGKLIPL